MAVSDMADHDFRRLAQLSLLVWCLFILYGSFLPFRFDPTPDAIRRNLAQLRSDPWHARAKRPSTVDLVSNIVLFLPFGFLLAGAGSDLGANPSWPRRLFRVAVAAVLFGSMVESAQLFFRGRTASLLDVAGNTMGAVIGGVTAWSVSRPFAQRWAREQIGRARRQPAYLGLVLLTLTLAAEAFYPFDITLDVSTVAQNVRQAQQRLLAPLGFRHWSDLVVDSVLAFALVIVLLYALRVKYAWAATVVLAAGLQSGKLLFVGPVPNLEGALLGTLGASLGMWLRPNIAGASAGRKGPALALASLLFVHAQLTPFDFKMTAAAVSTKAGRIEWVPLMDYYAADPRAALLDLWRKLLVAGYLGFCVASAAPRRPGAPLAVALVAGLLLEATQLLLASRVPSITDAVVCGLGGLAGGRVARAIGFASHPGAWHASDRPSR